MDIPRAPTKNRKRYVQGGAAAGAVILLTVLLSSLKPAAPSVDASLVVLDSVRRGTMVREVRGNGTLVPEHIRWISALTPARVERIFIQPGAEVTPTTVLLELANPDAQIEALEAQRQLSAAEADLVNLRMNLQSQRLTQAALVATTRTEFLRTKREAEVAESLAVFGGISRNEASLARDRAAEYEARLSLEEQRLELLASAVDSQLAVQRQQVERLRAITAFRLSRVNSLRVTAGSWPRTRGSPVCPRRGSSRSPSAIGCGGRWRWRRAGRSPCAAAPV